MNAQGHALAPNKTCARFLTFLEIRNRIMECQYSEIPPARRVSPNLNFHVNAAHLGAHLPRSVPSAFRLFRPIGPKAKLDHNVILRRFSNFELYSLCDPPNSSDQNFDLINKTWCPDPKSKPSKLGEFLKDKTVWIWHIVHIEHIVLLEIYWINW